MPFAKDARGVSGGFEDLGDSRCAQGEALALKNGVRDPILEFMAPGEERCPSRRASGAHVEICDPNTHVVQMIQIRRLEHGMSMARHVAVALVVCENEDDVWMATAERFGTLNRVQDTAQNKSHT